MGALLSFLGGSAFRMIWGEVSSYFTKRQDHKYEIQRMELENKFASDQHARNLEAQRLQVELGHKTIAIQAEADVGRTEAEAFRAAMESAFKPTGVAWLDAINGLVRPAYGYTALVLWLLSVHQAGWTLTAWSLDLMAVIVGFFFADRSLRKRGK